MRNNRTNKPAGANENKEITYLKLESFRVLSAREWDSGYVTAIIAINGVVVYNVRVMQTKDGNHEFLSFPSRKGNDGKYYPCVYVALSDEDTAKIIEAIDDRLSERDIK